MTRTALVPTDRAGKVNA